MTDATKYPVTESIFAMEKLRSQTNPVSRTLPTGTNANHDLADMNRSNYPRKDNLDDRTTKQASAVHMSSRPPTTRQNDPGTGPGLSSPWGQADRHSVSRNINLQRPLPPLPPSSSLPNSYEIPALRRKPVPAPETQNTAPLKHNRSISHPFPLFFGGKKLDKKFNEDDLDSSDSGSPSRRDMQRSKTGPTPSSTSKTDRQPVTGKCMTCDSTVRWPQGLKIFRCTTCLTVNDLEPFDENSGTLFHEQQAPVLRPRPISIAKTKSLIDQCLTEYMSQQLQTCGLAPSAQQTSEPYPDVTRNVMEAKPGERANSVNPTSTGPNMYTRPRDGAASRSQTMNPVQDRYVVAFDSSTPDPPNRMSSSPGRSRQHHARESSRNDTDAAIAHKDPSLAIFRNLEAYVSGCFAGCASMNMSFFSTTPVADTSGTPDQDSKLQKSYGESSGTPQFEPDSFISELDAKTLLLGDVVENGSWWTGRTVRNEVGVETNRDRDLSPEKWRGLVSVKTPRINWMELAEWYRILIHAGDDWRRRWAAMKPLENDSLRKQWESVSQSRIQHHIIESQLHLQRALMKATESLLKRPRRPLKSPEDCRFLFMLLANPLLLPSSQQLAHTSSMTASRRHAREPSRAQSNMPPSPSKPSITSPRRTGSLGHHSGVLKRIFGLFSNLSNEIHQFMVSWMSRFSDSHFQMLVDMVGSFVTYRLSRQQDRSVHEPVNPTDGLVPSFSDSGMAHASQLHAALELRPSSHSRKKDHRPKLGIYSEDWQIRAAARLMALLFQANIGHSARRRDVSISHEQRELSAGLNAKYQAYIHGQIVPISTFYSTMLDHLDLVGDFEAWETTKTKFTFCQYPFFLSIWAKIHILEHDARRQMEVKAREAFFDSILSRKAVSQYLVVKVRRDCLVEDSLRNVSEIVGSGSNDIKKGLRIDFVGEEGIDAGGLRKEWFLLLVREIFDPHHGLFVYDEDSQYCYFNPFCFESSEQFFMVGVLLGLAIYNSTILDIAFPPFVFKKMLASAPTNSEKLTSTPKLNQTYSLEDLAEFRPALAKGLRQLLDFDGDVQETFCRDFVVEMDRYGELVGVPLCTNGQRRPVTNSNRREFVDLYVRYQLDTAVARQYEPFKRGFFTVCGGNALSLFRPEEIELLVRGSDEPLDINSLRAVATYDNWPKTAGPPEVQPQVVWFWESFQRANPENQRKLLGFITGSDRIPAMGATNLVIRLQLIRDKDTEESELENNRFPIARTCFNTLSLHRYRRKETLESKLWMAVMESEGFGLK